MNPLPPWDGTAHNFSLLMITHTDVLGLCAYYIGRVRAKSQMHSTITTTISKKNLLSLPQRGVSLVTASLLRFGVGTGLWFVVRCGSVVLL